MISIWNLFNKFVVAASRTDLLYCSEVSVIGVDNGDSSSDGDDDEDDDDGIGVDATVDVGVVGVVGDVGAVKRDPVVYF